MAYSVLVIGAGIAGIEAALNLADYGVQVYLVEKAPSIGGLMARLNKTFPTNDCSICIEAPKMYEVQRHPNISLLTNCEVQRVTGEAGDFKVRLVKKARFVDEDKCTGCGKCVEACPVSVPDEVDGKIGGQRKLIYIPFPQAVPNCYLIDPRCRYGEMVDQGACVGECEVDCIQCRECPIAECVKACKEEGADAVMLWQRNTFIDLQVSSIIIASGLEPFEPPSGLYGYGLYGNVITNFQYERLTNAGGPTLGEIVRPSDNAHPESIAWIQCVGREKRVGISYCSKVCCMVATKQAIITREHDENIETKILYIHLKTYGKTFYEFYRRAKKLGVNYIKGRPSGVFQNPETGRMTIRYENLDAGKIEESEVDLLVLSTGLVAGRHNRRLSRILKTQLDEHGFFKTENVVSKPFETTVKGIYACGGALGPADISESVVQAIACSLRASAWR